MPDDAPKVLFLDSIPHWGGGQKWCVRTAQALTHRGFPVIVGCAPGSELEARAVGAGLSVWRIRFSGLLAPLAGVDLSIFLGREDVDLVVANVGRDLRMAALACALSKAKLVQRRGIARPMKSDWLHRAIYRNRVDAVVANCQAIVDRMRQGSQVLPAERFRVIPNSVEPAPVSEAGRAAARVKLGLADDQIAVGMLGRLAPMKGLENLIDAWTLVVREHAGARLFLAGSGELEDDLRGRVRRHGTAESVRFLGFLREPGWMLEALDLFVLPSLRDEGCSNAVLEAMAHGLPSVVTNCGGLPELIESGRTGRVAPKNHPESLALAVSDLVGDERMRRSMGERALAVVRERYTAEVVTDAWEALVRELTRGSAGATVSPGVRP